MTGSRLKDFIFVPSVQHTGTWFTINFLKNFIPISYELTNTTLFPEAAILHVHLPIKNYMDFNSYSFNTEFEKKWLSNLTTKRSLPVPILLLFCDMFKTVIPVRDPLAAILTREARYPQFRHFFIVDGFVALATEFAKHPNVVFLPIDLYTNEMDRKNALIKVVNHCDIKINESIIDAVAKEWPIENNTPNNRFKQLYNDGNIDEIRRLLGSKWAEVEYLKNMAAKILPFMDKLGYAGYSKLW